MIFRFATGWALILLPVALAAGWLLARRRRLGGARLRLPRTDRCPELGGSFWTGVNRSMPWIRTLALVLLVAALARPQSGARTETVSTHGVDIVVALDNSGSMKAEDFQPLNRLAVAKRTVAEFVSGRKSDRIGLVVFAGLSVTRCPLTIDHAMLDQFLEEVSFADVDGTAIGMGLATAVNRLRPSSAESKVVVLVTDGRNNRGEIGPETAAEAARTLGVKVYTVGVGSEGLVPIPMDTPLGRRYVSQQLDLDEELLRDIADRTGGQYFRATDPEALRGVFETIDALETTEIETRVRVLYAELFRPFVVPAAGLLLLEGLLFSTRLRRIP